MGESEVTSETIGETVMEHLRELDDVAYVRFASVYRNFREAKDFETALAELSGEEAADDRAQVSAAVSGRHSIDDDQPLHGAGAGARPARARPHLAQSGGRRGDRQGRRHRRPRLDAARRPAACRDRGAAAGRRGGARRDALRHARALLASRQDAALRRRHHRGRHRARRLGARRSQSRGRGRRAMRGCAPRASRSRSGSAPRRRGAIMPATSAACATAGRMSCSSSRSRPTARPARPGASRSPITGEAARERVHLLRAQSDAILIGIGTVLADDPLLTCRLPGMAEHSPVRVVLDSMLRLPLDSRLVQSARETPVWVSPALPRRQAAEVRPAAARRRGVARRRQAPAASISPPCSSCLAARGITRLMVEGGPTLAAALLAADLVDEAVLFRSPKVVGPDGIDALDADAVDGADTPAEAGRQRGRWAPTGKSIMQRGVSDVYRHCQRRRRSA